jgi:hypothetical protein
MRLKIRRATTDDLPWIMDQLREFSRYYRSEAIAFPNDAYAETYLTGLIEKHVFLLADSDADGLIGLIAGALLPHPYNPEKLMMSEFFYWVSEKHQKTRAALMLLNAYVKLGQETADFITFSKLPHSPLSERALTKRGFKLTELSYLKEVS